MEGRWFLGQTAWPLSPDQLRASSKAGRVEYRGLSSTSLKWCWWPGAL